MTGELIPDFGFDTLDGTGWRSRGKVQGQFRLLVIYRGMWCPHCKAQLKDLNAFCQGFRHAGVEPVAVSTDSRDRCIETRRNWALDRLDLGYGMPIDAARKLGIFVSAGINDREMPLFCEPAIFLINTEKRVQAAWIASNAFARTKISGIRDYIDFLNAHPNRATTWIALTTTKGKGSVMTIKNILAAYSSEVAHCSGVNHAIKLAQHHDAWLTGILRHGKNTLEQRYLAEIRDMIADQLREADAKRVKEVAARFAEMVGQAGLQDRSEFVDLSFEAGVALSDYARNFDLIVTGVHNDEVGESHLSANPDLIALRSGRPVIVVPNDYESEGLADHALVAWDGKRSSARALGDAMSILEEKPKVTIVTVGNEETRDRDLVMRNLSRHGIDANYRVAKRQGSIAKTVLGVADEIDAKLIVMGAFEHSKFAHTLIGGVTTDVIKLTTVPVFMSH